MGPAGSAGAMRLRKVGAMFSDIRRLVRPPLRALLGPNTILERRGANGSVLSVDPPIVYTTLGWPDVTGNLWSYGTRLGNRRALVVIYLSWHFGPEPSGQDRLHSIHQYRAAFPEHEVVFACNAPDEVATLRRAGEKAHLLNHNLTVSERFFRPLSEAEPTLDAVYNARLSDTKRLWLARDIPTVGYILRKISEDDSGRAAEILQSVRQLEPAHRIFNRIEAGRPVLLDGEAVNAAYSQAAVGLCLSEVEGAMLSSMEYMLAGLPIVSTPSLGGRDLFFDPEYCLVVPPDPGRIRDAVAALRARGIPRAYVREKTLLRIGAQRRSFLALLDDFLVRSGYEPRFGDRWPWLEKRSLCAGGNAKKQIALAGLHEKSRPARAVAGS